MFIQLQIDRGLLQRGKEVLNRLPQNKYNEDNFHLITKGMKRDDLKAVVEMIEANTFYKFMIQKTHSRTYSSISI